MKKFTFNDLRTSLEKTPSLSENADAVKTLVGSVAVLLGDTATGNVAGFIRAISEKDKLIDMGKIVLQKIIDKKPVNYVTKIDQMKDAYGLIYFTAFFDALDHTLPDHIRKSINLSLKEKGAIFQESIVGESDVSELHIPKGQMRLHSHLGNKMKKSIDAPIIFPDIVYSSAKVDGELQTLYEIMTGSLLAFVEKLAFWEHAEEKEIRIFKEVIESLPQMALKQFHEQYLYLSSNFEEFYVFAQMEKEKEQEIESGERYRILSSLLRDVDDKIDISLGKLTELITTLPGRAKEEEARKIAEGLAQTYRRSIEKPVVDSQNEDEKLVYPLISEAFIPQIYKILRYTGQEKLELVNTWDKFEPQKDMTSFWTKYYLDPDSLDNILLILGEPGIGKSLLTRVLCARMSSDTGVFIRIPLREHDMEEKIESIVLSQLRRDGDPSVDIPTLKWFAEEFPDNPITLVFDGYDEVLQATGGVYRKLLKEIHDFQKKCYERSRPVRVIVTSRETLIDKADIPSGSLVMKLLEFDDDQKLDWIEIWNKHNHDILSKEGLEDFQLPENNVDVEKLSGQPLLLLMLAIYDANFELKINSLTKQSGQAQTFNRSMLYDELLRRFVRRELRKGPKGEESAFDEADESEQAEMVNEEMKKLGIAALGMFVREKLFLTADELEHDLEYMKVKAAQYSMPAKRTLKKAEIVFGSFFFIHHSEMENEEDKKDAAYEFLHKTFYEFLVADLILFYLVESVDNLYFCLNNRNRNKGEVLYWDILQNPDNFSLQYYAALNGVCLCTEPEIIRMTAEWKDAKIAACTLQELEFKKVLPRIMKDIFDQHASMIQSGTFAPSADRWCDGSLPGDKSGKSFPESCAVYLINLLTLRSLVCGASEVDVELWNFVSQYFKLNAPLPQNMELESLKSRDRVSNLVIPASEEMILKFMALFEIRRKKNNIILIQKQNNSINLQNDLIVARAEVFDFLQDDTSRMVYELQDHNISANLKQKYRKALIEKGANLELELIIQQLKSIKDRDYEDVSSIRSIRYLIVEYFRGILMRKDEDLVMDGLLCIREILDNIPYSVLEFLTKDIGSNLSDIMIIPWDSYILEIILNYKKDIAYVFLDIVKKIGHTDRMIGAKAILEIMENPKAFSPDLVCKILDSTFGDYRYRNEGNHYIVDQLSFNNNFRKWFYVYKNASPKQLAAVLKIFGVYFRISIPDYLFSEIQMRWDKYLKDKPEELPELFRIYLQLGRFDEVRWFYEHSSSKIAYILGVEIENQTLIDEFLEIAGQVCTERWILRELLELTFGRDSQVLFRVCMKELYYVLSGGEKSEYAAYLKNTFLSLYGRYFLCYISESVLLLYYLVKRLSVVKETDIDDFYKPCLCNLEYYLSILNESVNAAAHALQTWFEFRERIQKNATYEEVNERKMRTMNTNLSFYAEKCFDKALLTRDEADVDILIELLISMDSETKCRLQNYFKERSFYFMQYSERLSDVIDQMYI